MEHLIWNFKSEKWLKELSSSIQLEMAWKSWPDWQETDFYTVRSQLHLILERANARKKEKIQFTYNDYS